MTTMLRVFVVLFVSVPMLRAAEPAVLPHRVPDGYVIDKVASDPDIVFPMFACFDDRGRLFVAESSGLDLYAELKAQTRKCRIRLLEDPDERGRFRKSSVFADQLVFPMGLVWREGKLYVADPPDLITLEANNADGTPRATAGKRSVILTGFGHVDNGSLHGLIFGPDGLLYMTLGQPDGYKITRRDGTLVTGKTGALLRCRPDGSHPEVLCRGFENLVEIVFTARGDIIGTDNWFQTPSGGIRDALVHLVEGGLYPRHADIGTPQPITGEPLPPVSLFPAVALSGLEIYRGQNFPAELRGQLFSAQHNSRKVGRHLLVPEGSTFRSQDFDFVTSDDPDFHPADVLEDADGSLLVLDTGSWYVHHCPTGQIRKTKATGGIYRVAKAGAAAVADPWGLKLDWNKATAQELADLLADSRPKVRDRARLALARRGQAAFDPLSKLLHRNNPTQVRQEAIWTLASIDHEEAFDLLRHMIDDKYAGKTVLAASRRVDPDVAIPALRGLALRRERADRAPRLKEQLGETLLRKAEVPEVRLAVAEALARCGDVRSVLALWKALEADPDRFLDHALTHAIHHLADAAALEAALKNPHPRVQRAALLLLDQPPRPKGQLKPEQVIPRFSSTDPELRLTARRILQRHPEWADQALGLVRGWLEKPTLAPDEQLGLRGLLLSFQTRAAVQEIVALVVAGKDDRYPADRRVLVLETLAEMSLPKLPNSWTDALALAVKSAPPAVRLQAIRTSAVLQATALDEALAKLADEKSEKPELRLEALRAVVLRRPELSPASFELVLAQLKEEDRPLAKLSAAEIAGRAKLSDAQTRQLLDAIRGDALIAPAVVFPALERVKEPATAKLVVDYLADAIKAGWKPGEPELERLARSLPAEVREQAGTLRELVRQSGERQRARLAEFEALLAGGSGARGRAVFFGKKVACATCHRIGAEGGTVGPDLTKVGAIRAGRDLLESIVVPSSTVAQGFDPYVIAMADGRVINGIIARQTAELLVVRDSTGGELQLRKDKIQEMRRSPNSIMPEGLERALSRDEFRDLLAFLQGLK